MESEQRDPESPYEPTAESGSENPAERESGPVPDDVLPPGSTAEGAGTSLGAEPDEDEEPLGSGTGTAKSEQLADDAWRTNGVNPLG